MLPRGAGPVVNVASVNAFFHPDGLVIDHGRRSRIGARAVTGGIATGRFTTAAEVATVVAMLASPRTANVTGADYVIG